MTQDDKNRFSRLKNLSNFAGKSDNNFLLDGDDYMVFGQSPPSSCATADPVESGGSIIIMFNDTVLLSDGSSYDAFTKEVNSFNSSWVACLVDAVRGQVFLAREPFGSQTIYSGYLGDAFIFTSSLTYLQNLGFNIDTKAVSSFLHFLYIPAPLTIFQGIRSILPGECVVFDGTNIELKPVTHANEQLDTDRNSLQSPQSGDATEIYENLLAESARKHSYTSGNVGLFLSGGKDSSALAIAAKLAGLDNILAVTLGFSDQAIDEGDDARCVAKHLGIPFHLLNFSESEYFELWPDVVNHLDSRWETLPFYQSMPQSGNSEMRLTYFGMAAAATLPLKCLLLVRMNGVGNSIDGYRHLGLSHGNHFHWDFHIQLIN